MLGLNVGMLGMQDDVLGLKVSKFVLDVSMLGLEINTCSETGEYAQRLSIAVKFCIQCIFESYSKSILRSYSKAFVVTLLS